MLLKRGTGSTERERETGNEKWQQRRELEMNILRASQLLFPSFIFPFPMLVPRFRFPIIATSFKVNFLTDS